MSGEWDFLIKIRSKDVQSVGRFLGEKLRTVKGLNKTVTCLVFNTAKETTEIENLSAMENQT
jgi:DNA-binding Lrp family transcriptional regulator